MKISDLLALNSINLNATASNKQEAIKQAVRLINQSGVLTDPKTYEEGVIAREAKMTTGIGEGIAIPHCKSKAVTKPALGALHFRDGVDYESLDGQPVKLLFIIAAPDSEDNVHLDVLARLSNVLMHPEYVLALSKARTPETFLNILDYAEATVELERKKQEEEEKKAAAWPKILAVTACPTGIAHTYMAEEALIKCAKEKGITIKVQTNGSGGIKNQLTDEEIAHAEGIIIAADVSVQMDCFNGKRLIQCPVTRAITKPGEVIDMALDPITSIYGEGRQATKQDKVQGGTKFQVFYRHLMSGVSHMIPFVIAGGICLALAYLIDNLCGVIPGSQRIDPTTGLPIFDDFGKPVLVSFGNESIGAQIFHFIGVDFGLALMFPILGGFIAYSIAGKPGLVAGFVGAAAAKEGRFSLLYLILLGTNGDSGWMDKLANSSAGFLGAIVAGFMAGYLVLFLNKKTQNVPRAFAGVKNMLLMPLFTSIIVAGAMAIVNVPLSFVNIGISTGLQEMAKIKGLGLLLGALAAGLMAIDMGGPINKATHYAIVAIVTSAVDKGLQPGNPQYDFALQLNAANLLGMLTPPAGIAIATWLFPQKFSKGDRGPSLANFVTGCCGITEGAIPYVLQRPVNTVLATVTGAAVGGIISMELGFTAIAPEGGFIGMVASNPQGFYKGFIACMSGALVTALILGFSRKDADPAESQLGRWKGVPTQPVMNFFKKIFAPVGRFFKKIFTPVGRFFKKIFTPVGHFFKKIFTPIGNFFKKFKRKKKVQTNNEVKQQ